MISVNGLRGRSLVWRVAKDEVAGLGHRQGDLNRVDVAHLADEEDIGVLARADRRARSNEGLSRPTSALG